MSNNTKITPTQPAKPYPDFPSLSRSNRPHSPLAIPYSFTIGIWGGRRIGQEFGVAWLENG